MGMSVQIFIPCFHGQQLINMTENLSMSLFHSSYNCKDKKARSAVKIFMENSKKPKKFRFYVFDVSLEQFVAIINAAYSLYAVLNNVNNLASN